MKTIEDIKHLVGLDNHHTNYGDIFRKVKSIISERDEMQGTINGLKHLVELPKSAGLTELFNAVEALELNKPQLNEIRYVLHGDIQPCSVLYSDDTTTLLRLDEGDIMCETDTIEWSDSVTYRCQELLRGFVGLTAYATLTGSAMKGMSHTMAQLVRDERILLNDDAEETVSGDTRHSPTSDEPCTVCNLPFDKNAMTCPVCNTIRPTPLR